MTVEEIISDLENKRLKAMQDFEKHKYEKETHSASERFGNAAAFAHCINLLKSLTTTP